MDLCLSWRWTASSSLLHPRFRADVSRLHSWCLHLGSWSTGSAAWTQCHHSDSKSRRSCSLSVHPVHVDGCPWARHVSGRSDPQPVRHAKGVSQAPFSIRASPTSSPTRRHLLVLTSESGLAGVLWCTTGKRHVDARNVRPAVVERTSTVSPRSTTKRKMGFSVKHQLIYSFT